MAIILEGFDNSGKSTLANAFGLQVVHPGPRPESGEAEYACIQRQLDSASDSIVMDRVTCISSPAYARNRPFHRLYKRHALNLLSRPRCVLIYCRPPIEKILDFSTHARKDHDTDVFVAELRRKARQVVASYDAIMHHLPHMEYDWTNPSPDVVQMAYDAQFSDGAWNKWLNQVNL